MGSHHFCQTVKFRLLIGPVFELYRQFRKAFPAAQGVNHSPAQIVIVEEAMAVGTEDIPLFIDETVLKVHLVLTPLHDMEEGLRRFRKRGLTHVDFIAPHALPGKLHVQERQIITVESDLVGILLPVHGRGVRQKAKAFYFIIAALHMERVAHLFAQHLEAAADTDDGHAFFRQFNDFLRISLALQI